MTEFFKKNFTNSCLHRVPGAGGGGLLYRGIDISKRDPIPHCDIAFHIVKLHHIGALR